MSTQQPHAIERYFPTEPWLEEYREALEADESYDETGADWGVDFDGSFVFHIENVPVDETTLADLPSELSEALDERLQELSEDDLESVLAAGPDEEADRIEERDGSLEESVRAELHETPLSEAGDRTWPELREALPEVLDELITQLEENVTEDNDVYAFLDVYDGGCREVEAISDLDERDYGFRIQGDYEDWKRLVSGDGGVVEMLMSGEFEIEGDMQKVMQYSDGATDLAEVAADVDSRFLI